ncbi:MULTISPECIES: MFS transporter [unclassified Kitasatospora]|uniref:MFS transporter n=1 Tax=unclassified Kitasatospora TaxID=2633591 RepID=UPI00070D27D7|nr:MULTISPECIES: MFS transporter [unclassified Kitasatospora]KQV15832.1 MFS transporter [Kitasatospora sp. Root107]KRB65070.1 MFS transporter [Kitasatospora sp. Root187]
MGPAAGTSKSSATGRVVLLALAAGQFLMALDSSVMNVSIATVAQDVGTTVTGVQGAITAYTLVMAMFMIPGGKVGVLIGRKRAFMIGCVVYGCGSLTTALAPNLPVLLFGWSFLEGIGAALILPAIVALVAGNFGPQRRPAAYGLVTAAGAVAIAVGPLIGGVATTFFSWRWVFAGEVVIVLAILVLARRIADAPADARPRIDLVGCVLSALGLGVFVYGVLRSDEWGWFQPKPDAPSWLGVSLVVWLMLAGLLLTWIFLRWESHLVKQRREPLVDPALLQNRQLTGGLTMFFFQYLVQMGVFFVVPLYLSVALGLSALKTGVCILPLSLTLLAAAVLIPRLLPDISPRRVVRAGILALLAGAAVLMAALDADAGAEIVTIPLLLIGLGMGALASQLGSVTVSAVPDEQSAEVGGVQNAVTNLGASIGTALAGSILIATMTASFLTAVEQNPAVPAQTKSQAGVELASGVPFLSDAQLQTALDEAGTSADVSQAALDANSAARLDGLRAALAVLALAATGALFFTQRIPATQPGRRNRTGTAEPEESPEEHPDTHDIPPTGPDT